MYNKHSVANWQKYLLAKVLLMHFEDKRKKHVVAAKKKSYIANVQVFLLQ